MELAFLRVFSSYIPKNIPILKIRAFFGWNTHSMNLHPTKKRQWHVKPLSLSLAEGFFRVTWKLEDPKSHVTDVIFVDRNPPTKRDPKSRINESVENHVGNVGAALCLLVFWCWKTLRSWICNNVQHLHLQTYQKMWINETSENWINEIHVEFIFQMEGSVYCMYFSSFSEVFCFFQFPRRWLFLNTTLRPLQRTSSTAVKKRTPFGVEDGTSKIFAMAVSSWYCWYRLAEKHRKQRKKNNNRKSENPLKSSPFVSTFFRRFRLFTARTTKKQLNKHPRIQKPSTVVNVTNPPRWLVVHHPPPITNQPSMPRPPLQEAKDRCNEMQLYWWNPRRERQVPSQICTETKRNVAERRNEVFFNCNIKQP